MAIIQSPKRTGQLKLGAFIFGSGHHIAAWRHPDTSPAAIFSFDYYRNLAEIAERGKFDTLFFADNVGTSAGSSAQAARGPSVYYFEPLTLLSALAVVTKNIGLISTVSATYLPPYHLARKFASLDHLSGGRAGWNLVTSGKQFEARNFGLNEQIPHAERYRRATEYLEVVKKLWDSWEDDAFLFDKAAGVYYDPEKLHVPDFQGTYFNVRGPLQSSRPIQGYPVLVQAGSSGDGQRLAAEGAEVVFTAQQTLEDGRNFYRSIKEQAVAAGRKAEEILIMPGIMPIIGRSEEEAHAKYQQLLDLVDPALSLGVVSTYIGKDLSSYPLDGPVPDLEATEGWKSRMQLFLDLAKKDNLTLRQLAALVSSARGHFVKIGTAEQIADLIEEWFHNEAADGFNILAPTFPKGLEDFVDQVIPILQARGLFRTEYEGNTLRENLGLPRPRNSYTSRETVGL